MTMTCNFERDDRRIRREDKLILRLPPVKDIGTDTPAIKPASHGAYLWLAGRGRRPEKSWRGGGSVN